MIVSFNLSLVDFLFRRLWWNKYSVKAEHNGNCLSTTVQSSVVSWESCQATNFSYRAFVHIAILHPDVTRTWVSCCNMNEYITAPFSLHIGIDPEQPALADSALNRAGWTSWSPEFTSNFSYSVILIKISSRSDTTRKNKTTALLVICASLGQCVSYQPNQVF